jgi:hypothetical protein
MRFIMTIEHLSPNILIIITSIFRLILIAVVVFYLVPYLRSTHIHKPTTKHIKWWMIWCLCVIIIGLLIQLWLTWTLIIWIMIIGWGFFFFDSRRFAVWSLRCLSHIILFTLLWDATSSEYYAIYLYYFLVLSVIFWLLESYLFDTDTK